MVGLAVAARDVTSASVEHAGSGGAFVSVALGDSGQDGDVNADDGVFTARVPTYAGELPRYLFTYTLTVAEAVDDESNAGVTPTTLFINELMASNSDTMRDPQGDDDDWIELLNSGSEAIDLAGMYLSDKASNPLKWRFPEGASIVAGGYLLVWADDDAGDSPGLHTNFKLSAGGEGVVLSDIDARDNALIDSVEFPALATDVSYGRSPEATGAFRVLAVASPGRATPVVPEVAIAADGPVTEGGRATFTVTAVPAPRANLTVNVTVTQGEGQNYLPDAPPTSVVVSAGASEGSLGLDVPNDTVDEPNGVLTATLAGGDGYVVASAGSASLTVRDDDLSPAETGLVINELMASNGGTVVDPQGDADDWIELFNTTAQRTDLSGMYLSDKRAKPKKWQFPAGTVVGARGYLLVWADDDTDDNPGLHANFKLSASGESVVLSDTDDNGNAVIDVVDFPPMARNESYARIPDGTGPFGVTSAVSPGTAPVESADATLNGLTLLGIDIGTFAGAVTAYTARVRHDVESTMVTASTHHASATYTVSPADADGDAPGHQVDLAVGMNEIVVTVTAADGTTTRTYTVAVTRAVPPPVATLAGAGAVAEGAPAVFEATLDRAPAAALTVAVAVSGSAGVLAGTPPASVAFAAGETRATLTVATAADRVIEADGTVTATLSAGEGYTLGADTVADVTVTDDDVAAWAVTASLAAIEEGGGATLTVSTGNGTTFPAEVAIALGVSGTVSEADYALSASSLTLAVGTGTVTATLSATEDDETEEAETATVTASVDGAAVGSTTLTVEDAAPAPTIAGVPQVGGVLEAVPSSAVGYQWLRAGEPIAGAVAERYAPVAADVDAALSVRVDARGRWRTSAPTMPIWAAPVSPPLAAGEEELLGTTMTLGRGAAVYQLAGFLRRGDWERWPEDFGSVDDASFADGRHELRAFLVNEPGTFGVATAPDMGDATDVTAYWNEHALGALEVQETSGATVWVAPAAPNSERYFHTAPEASEGVRVAVSLRRPLPEATLTASSETVAEGASATFAVDLDRAAWSALEVAVAVTEAGTMLSGSVPATVTFAAGESTATLTLATDDDAVVEGDGALTVALAPGDGYVVGTAASAGTAVTDNDAAEFDVSAAPDGIDEGGAATLTVSIGNGVTFAVDQAIALSVSGTAVSDDYRLSATSLVLGAGTSSVSATLTALRDVWAEPAETVTVTATRAGSAVGAATVTIAANEAVVSTVTVTAVATPVTEGAAAQFELRLDAAALAALTVAVSASETGSVLSGTAPATVAFAVGESSGTISLATDDDTVVEADGAVTLTLLSGSGYVAGAAAAAVVTVADNDSATFDVSASSGEIDEGEETTVTVSIGNGVTFAAEQRIVLSVSGTATAADYLLAPSALTLAAGASSVEATLTAVDDTDEELAETVTVTATRAGSAVGAVTVTIRTSDVPSDDATLASLTLSGVDIGSFAADVTDYTAAVETEVASTTVTATAHDAGAAVVVADGSGSTAGDTRTVALGGRRQRDHGDGDGGGRHDDADLPRDGDAGVRAHLGRAVGGSGHRTGSGRVPVGTVVGRIDAVGDRELEPRAGTRVRAGGRIAAGGTGHRAARRQRVPVGAVVGRIDAVGGGPQRRCDGAPSVGRLAAVGGGPGRFGAGVGRQPVADGVVVGWFDAVGSGPRGGEGVCVPAVGQDAAGGAGVRSGGRQRDADGAVRCVVGRRVGAGVELSAGRGTWLRSGGRRAARGADAGHVGERHGEPDGGVVGRSRAVGGGRSGAAGIRVRGAGPGSCARVGGVPDPVVEPCVRGTVGVGGRRGGADPGRWPAEAHCGGAGQAGVGADRGAGTGGAGVAGRARRGGGGPDGTAVRGEPDRGGSGGQRARRPAGAGGVAVADGAEPGRHDGGRVAAGGSDRLAAPVAARRRSHRRAGAGRPDGAAGAGHRRQPR